MESPSIEQVSWVFRHLRKHFEEGGSFRYLIYNRLGFTDKDYQELYQNGGFALSQMANFFLEYEKIINVLYEKEKQSKGLTPEEISVLLKEVDSGI